MNPPTATPGVIFWFKAYCWILCVMHFLFMLGSVSFFVIEPEKLEMPPEAAYITGCLLMLSAALFFFVFLLPLVLRPRPWLWVYDIVVICIGFSGACCWPICIPLLIFWIKPEVKQYFGKS